MRGYLLAYAIAVAFIIIGERLRRGLAALAGREGRGAAGAAGAPSPAAHLCAQHPARPGRWWAVGTNSSKGPCPGRRLWVVMWPLPHPHYQTGQLPHHARQADHPIL